jgi:hypothetical protein
MLHNFTVESPEAETNNFPDLFVVTSHILDVCPSNVEIHSAPFNPQILRVLSLVKSTIITE